MISLFLYRNIFVFVNYYRLFFTLCGYVGRLYATHMHTHSQNAHSTCVLNVCVGEIHAGGWIWIDTEYEATKGCVKVAKTHFPVCMPKNMGQRQDTQEWRCIQHTHSS